jgi:hypothetical protein
MEMLALLTFVGNNPTLARALDPDKGEIQAALGFC